MTILSFVAIDHDAVIPIGFKDTKDQREILEELRKKGFPVPVVISERSSLMEGSWRQQCSPFKYVEEHRSRKRDYELETLEQFDELARYLEQDAGIVSTKRGCPSNGAEVGLTRFRIKRD